MGNSNQSGGNIKSKFKFSSQSKASKDEKKEASKTEFVLDKSFYFYYSVAVSTI